MKVLSMQQVLFMFTSAAVLALALGTASAQTPAKAGAGGQKTIGGKTATGKVMTRDELRACFARRDELNVSAKKVEAERTQLDAERTEVVKEGDAIKADRAEVDKRLAAVREWEERVKAHRAAVEAYNTRTAEAQAAKGQQQKDLLAKLTEDRAALEKTSQQLQADEAALVPVYQAAVKTYNDKATARDAKVTSWNERNTAALKNTETHEDNRKTWVSECANRPYREDDEIAIKKGK
jgi:chromosome segregation ATPase